MAKTIAQLRTEAQTIKNETNIGANTATRVGGFGEDIVDYLEDNSSSGGTFATGEDVGDVSVFDDVADLTGKTSAEKALMLPNAIAVSEIKTPVDLTTLNEVQINSSPGKTWGNAYKGKFLPVKAGEVYNFDASTATANAIIIPLKNCVWKVNVNYVSNIATGYTDRIVIPPSTPLIGFVVPNDCTVIYVQTTTLTGDITPSIEKVEQAQPLDDMPTEGSNKAVTSDGILKGFSLLASLDKYVSGAGFNLSANMFWTANSSARYRLFSVTEGDYIRIKANAQLAAFFAFLKSTGTIANNQQPVMASARYSMVANSEIDLIAPSGATLLYVLQEDANGNHLPQVNSYKPLSNVMQGHTEEKYELQGGDTAASYALYQVVGDGIYEVLFDRTEWGTANINTGTLLFRLALNDTTWIANIIKGTAHLPMQRTYYIKAHDGDSIIFGWRADVGQTLGCIIRNVTAQFDKKLQDIQFTNGSSAMVKVKQGQLVRYSVYSSSDYLKAYSRAKQSSTYLVDTLSASSAGYQEGEYMPTQDVFVVAFSDTHSGFTPSLQVYEYGENVDEIVYPNQMVADTANIVTILSSTDADVSNYDNKYLNHCKILQVSDNMWYMWYMAFGTSSNSLPHIMMCTSTDGLAWTRGLPSGKTPVIANTNVILKPANNIVPNMPFTYQAVNEFDVVMVADNGYPFRMVANIRNASTATVTGEVMWLFKSDDGVTWIPLKQITSKPHDSYPRAIVNGNLMKIYLRMWDYNVPTDDQRCVGVFFVTLDGNVVVPPSGIGGYGLYNTGATAIDVCKELIIPTHYYPDSQDDCLEAYIIDGKDIRYCPIHGLENLRGSGWAWVSGMLSVWRNNYLVYEQSPTTHSITPAYSEFRMCPVQWVTYAMYNHD